MRKRSLVKVCLGLLLATGLGTAIAESSLPFITTESGLKIAITQHGSGPVAREGQVVILHYVGTLEDGTEFDSSRKRGRPFAFTLGKRQVIKGYEEAFKQLRVGDKATLVIPPQLAYGEKGVSGIPPNSVLTFQIEVLKLEDHALADTLGAAKFAGQFVSEDPINGLGYRYLKKEKVPEALAVFQWNVELFPRSADALDSLAEGYSKDGKAELAAEACTKALAMDPKIRNSKGAWCATRSSS